MSSVLLRGPKEGLSAATPISIGLDRTVGCHFVLPLGLKQGQVYSCSSCKVFNLLRKKSPFVL